MNKQGTIYLSVSSATSVKKSAMTVGINTAESAKHSGSGLMQVVRLCTGVQCIGSEGGA